MSGDECKPGEEHLSYFVAMACTSGASSISKDTLSFIMNCSSYSRNSTGPRIFAYAVHMRTLVSSVRRDWDGERQSLELQYYMKECNLIDCGTDAGGELSAPLPTLWEVLPPEISEVPGRHIGATLCYQSPLLILPVSNYMSKRMARKSGCFTNACCSNILTVKLHALTQAIFLSLCKIFSGDVTVLTVGSQKIFGCKYNACRWEITYS